MVRLFEKWLKSSLITTALIVCLIWGEGILLSINENGITTRLVLDVTIKCVGTWFFQWVMVGVVFPITWALLPNKKPGESASVYAFAVTKKLIIGVVIFFLLGFLMNLCMPRHDSSDQPMCLPFPVGC